MFVQTVCAALITALGVLLLPSTAHAGAQTSEQLADGVRTLLRQSIFASYPSHRSFEGQAQQQDYQAWYMRTSAQLIRYIPERAEREQLLRIVDYEAHRAGLEPALVLSVMEVESRFNPRAISPVQARGLMQVMPFWTRSIGDGRVQNLHNARINVRYGCVILRHYLDRENGDVVRALARYNGSLGQTQYSQKVLRLLDKWR